MKLFLIPTPVGNLGDITLRALEVLKSVDALLCEDTRTSGFLLKHYHIQKPLYPFHLHNEHKRLEGIVEQIKGGRTMALLSDAGTPGISDPGFLLVRACLQEGVEVECLPGATAFVPALVQSGLPTDRFVFEGFLPLKKGRKTRLEQLVREERTVVLYESPHRLLKLLGEMLPLFGPERQIYIGRELTKKFEENLRGTLPEHIARFEQKAPKGEFVLAIEGRPAEKKKGKRFKDDDDDMDEEEG